MMRLILLATLVALLGLVTAKVHPAPQPFLRGPGFVPLLPRALPPGFTLAAAREVSRRSLWIWYRGRARHEDFVLLESRLPLSDGVLVARGGRPRWRLGPGGTWEGLLHRRGVYVLVEADGLAPGLIRRTVGSLAPEGHPQSLGGWWSRVLGVFGGGGGGARAHLPVVGPRGGAGRGQHAGRGREP